MKTKPCKQCGNDFTLTQAAQRYCPDCREERFNAAHPLRTCPACGEQKREFSQSGACWDCRLETMHQRRDRMIQKRHQAHDERRRLDYLQQFNEMPIEQKEEQLAVALARILTRLSSEQAAAHDEPTPEQVEADEQAYIDATVSDLLADLDI